MSIEDDIETDLSPNEEDTGIARSVRENFDTLIILI